jgi:hypothetical protein
MRLLVRFFGIQVAHNDLNLRVVSPARRVPDVLLDEVGLEPVELGVDVVDA